MPFPGKVPAEAVRFIKTGPHATRAKVATQFSKAPIGTIYISAVATGSTGRIYFKVTESGGATGTATDWQKVTTSAAD